VHTPFWVVAAADFGGCFWPHLAVQPRIQGGTSSCKEENRASAVWVGREAPNFGGLYMWVGWPNFDQLWRCTLNYGWSPPPTLPAVFGPSRPSDPGFGAERVVVGRPTGRQRRGCGGRHLISVGCHHRSAVLFLNNYGGENQILGGRRRRRRRLFFSPVGLSSLDSGRNV
jgi:hypothetical protein